MNETCTYPCSPITDPYGNWYPKIKKVKRVTRTVEKYDPEGHLIGREIITEEYEDFEKEVWEPNIYWINDRTGGTQDFCTVTSSINLGIN